MRRLPLTYMTFVYRRPEFKTAQALSERMQRDLSSFIRANYSEFQTYMTIAIYYDGGYPNFREIRTSSYATQVNA